jgi:NADPH:quinone reductase-like Zn-dependent oxidoreductase
VLASGGKVVTIAAQSVISADQRVRDAFMLVRADGSQLAQIANLIAAGELCSFAEKVFPLAATREACSHAQRGRNRGKVALQLTG